MRLLSPRSCVAAALLLSPLGNAWAASQSCRPAAIAQLRAASTDGYAIYEQTSRRDFFASWIDCDAAQFDLSTAVHESTHFVTSETDAFPLVGGGAVERPHEASDFFPPYRIADRFDTDDFVSTYLRRGKASSSTDFIYLLDEFNAYSHDLGAAVDLKDLASPDEVVDHRDGLAALMAFVAAYAEMARAGEPDTWNGLQQPRVANTITALWTRAERVMASSCGIPNFGTSDKDYIRRACAAGSQSAIAQIIGQAPVCPAACLEPTPGLEDTVGEAGMAPAPSPLASQASVPDIEDRTASIRPRHPFAGNAGPRRHPRRADDE